MTMQLVDTSVLVPVLDPAARTAPTARHRRTAVVIGHRGASGYRPEHTLAAYELAIALGADAIEPDLVTTRDGVLVARHENEISGTTDVATRPEYAARRATKTVDGRRLTGWFTEDFTLAELRTLRATERLGAVRPANRLHDGRWPVVTLDEILDLVQAHHARTGHRVRLYLELKHSSYFARLGFSLEQAMLTSLRRRGLDRPDAEVWVESFETTNLRWLARHSSLPLVQLVEDHGAPADGSLAAYADLLTPAGLAEVATYAAAIGAHKDLVLPRDPVTGRLTGPSGLVGDAHGVGLQVVVWTLRAENQFLPADFRVGSDPTAHGDLAAEVRAHREAGVDGIFTDFPDLAVEPDDQAFQTARSSRRWGTSTHATR